MASAGEHDSRYSGKDHYLETPTKRRRITPSQDFFTDPEVAILAGTALASPISSTAIPNNGQTVWQDAHQNISISASSKQAGQTVAPFLAKHIPEQHAPAGGLDTPGNGRMKDPNTKYCYRHRPDLKCRRQANEPSMDHLQHVSPLMPHGQKRKSLIKSGA